MIHPAGPDNVLRVTAMDELKERRRAAGPAIMPVTVILENVRSLHNVGAFFRTADGACVERVILSGITAPPPRKEIAKVALGAELVVAWQQAATPEETVALARQTHSDLPIFAIEHTPASRGLFDLPIPFPCAVVFGHEVEGVSPALLSLCTAAIEVPMFGTKESLNVSVCGGVVLYEIRRQWEARRAEH